MAVPCPYPEGQKLPAHLGSTDAQDLIALDLDGLKVPWKFYFTEVTSNSQCFYVFIFKNTQHCQDGTLCTSPYKSRQQSQQQWQSYSR